MVFDYTVFKVGQKLYNKRNSSFSIIKVTSNSITLSNGHVVQMYSDNKLYYYFQDNLKYKHVYIEYFLNEQ